MYAQSLNIRVTCLMHTSVCMVVVNNRVTWYLSFVHPDYSLEAFNSLSVGYLKMIYTGNLRVGWIGLGSMGLAMATNIQRHIKLDGVYPALKYWNRTLERGKPLEELGATACPTIADLAQSCDVIFISVRL